MLHQRPLTRCTRPAAATAPSHGAPSRPVRWHTTPPPPSTRAPALARDAEPTVVPLPDAPALNKLPGAAARAARRHDARSSAWFAREAAYLARLVDDLALCGSDEDKVSVDGGEGGEGWEIDDAGWSSTKTLIPFSIIPQQVVFLRRNARVKSYFENTRYVSGSVCVCGRRVWINDH